MLRKVEQDKGFIAALDQSGGSTPKALALYGIPEDRTGLYLLPFAISNFFGPVLLGGFFDTVGRKPMIAGTYTVSAVLLSLTGYLFAYGHLTTVTQTLLWALIFAFEAPFTRAARRASFCGAGIRRPPAWIRRGRSPRPCAAPL